MGVMNKLRENTGVILWILVFAFGVIWVLQDSGGLDVVGNLGNNIGSVNGDPITYEEYNQAIDARLQNYQQSTGESMPPQMIDQTRDQVFNQLVDIKLRMQEMDRLGLSVANAEIVEMIQGDNPHQIIHTYFGDGQGNVDRALLQNFIENPDARNDWLQIEDYLRNERLSLKLDRLITATARISNDDVNEELRRKYRKADVRYVSLRYTELPDDSISYDEGDLQNFYDDHRDEFERKRSYSLSYVMRSKAPTAADTTIVFEDLGSMRESFESTSDDSLFLVRNGSERLFTDVYFRPDELDTAIANAVFENVETGSVVGPIISGNQIHLVKVLDVRPPEETAVRASHILFRASEGDDALRAEARQSAVDVLRQIRQGEDFAQMAREFSDDGSAASGGDLNWFGPGRMVKPFEDAAFAARVDQVVGPIETQFGYHLIKVTDRATVEAKLADFALTIRASVETLNRIQEQLDDLQYFSTETDDFIGEAGRRELSIQTVLVESDQTFIPGIGNSRLLTNFLEDADVGDVSAVIELNDQFMVATVDLIQPKGFRPLEEVRTQIEPRLRNELKAAIQFGRLQDGLAQGFDSLAAAVGATERTAEGLSYENMVVAGIGRDPKFVGTALGLEEEETSSVIEGQSAVYVIHITRAEDAGIIPDEERSRVFDQLLQRRQSLIRSQWITSLREEADIVDNRRLFLQ